MPSSVSCVDSIFESFRLISARFDSDDDDDDDDDKVFLFISISFSFTLFDKLVRRCSSFSKPESGVFLSIICSEIVSSNSLRLEISSTFSSSSSSPILL